MKTKDVLLALRRNDVLSFRGEILTNAETALSFCEAFAELTDSKERTDRRIAKREKLKIDAYIHKNISQITPRFVLRLALMFYQRFEKNTKPVYPGTLLFDVEKGDLMSSKQVFQVLTSAFSELFMPIWDNQRQEAKAIYLFYIQYCWGLPFTGIWPNMLEICRSGDLEARETVRRFLKLAYFSGHIGSFEYHNMDAVKESPLADWGKICAELCNRDILPLAFYQNDEWLAGPCMKEVDIGVRQMISTFAEIKTFMQYNAQPLLKRYREMWQDICEEPRYGIRSHGADLVKINLPHLSQSGFVLKSIQFIAEEHNYPEVGIKIYFSLDGVELEHALTFKQDLFFEDITSERMHFSNYLTLLVTYCYWRIIIGEDRVLYDYDDERKVSSKLKPGKGGEVRPHRRWLLPNHHVSQKALHNAELQYRKKNALPPGQTFVVKHKRHRGKCQPSQPKPLFVVNESDMTIHEEKVLV